MRARQILARTVKGNSELAPEGLTKLVTTEQMMAIDRRTIDEWGIPAAELMERAARRVVEVIESYWDGLEDLAVLVVCGKGNNGGDGLAVARLLGRAGVRTQVFLAAPRGAFLGEAAAQLAAFEAEGGCALEALTPRGIEVFAAGLTEVDLAVDALLGTGTSGPPRAEMVPLIEGLNRWERPVVAVDMPTGMDGDTGQVPGACVQAALTVTFGQAKVGQFFYPGRRYCGTLLVEDIGFPQEVVAQSPAAAYQLSARDAARMLPARQPNAHKGSFGWVALVAGSVGMTGAAALAAESAMRSGVGRVSLGVPASLNDVLEAKLTEVMTRPLPEVRKHRCLALRGVGEVRQMASRCQVLALGPGLGRHRETAQLVRRLVETVDIPVVVDADGLNALAGFSELIERRQAPLVLTPHLGEFAGLTGLSVGQIEADIVDIARAWALKWGHVLLLKGAPSLVACPDGRVIVNSTGNDGMATAGSGDVLTGVVAGLIAQGLTGDKAAILGMFIHGRAGDLARDRLGPWSMVAGDICQSLSAGFLAVGQQRVKT